MPAGASVRSVPNGNHADRPAWQVTSGPAPDTVERLLRLLPGWFGIESSVLEYVSASRTLPAYLAWPDGRAGEPSGVLLAVRHFPASAEIYLMAVDPTWHRNGAGPPRRWLRPVYNHRVVQPTGFKEPTS